MMRGTEVLATHRVVKAFDGHATGSEIDASAWQSRRVSLLVDQRYLSPISGVVCPDPSAHQAAGRRKGVDHG